MSRNFEELDYRETPLGPLILQRRRVAMLDDLEVHEVKLGNEYLMSSLFHDAEVALARLGLAASEGTQLEVAVGGLGLGYTAHAALEDLRVRSLVVVDALEDVIRWHQAGLVPLGAGLSADVRCRFVHADFFAKVRAGDLDPETPGRKFDVILLDIDHAPDFLLHASHGAFYTPEGLRQVAGLLKPRGVFAMWSDGEANPAFLASLEEVFADARAETVRFENPLQDGESSSTVYVAKRRES